MDRDSFLRPIVRTQVTLAREALSATGEGRRGGVCVGRISGAKMGCPKFAHPTPHRSNPHILCYLIRSQPDYLSNLCPPNDFAISLFWGGGGAVCVYGGGSGCPVLSSSFPFLPYSKYICFRTFPVQSPQRISKNIRERHMTLKLFPCAPAEARRWSFFCVVLFQEIWQEIWWELCGIFSHPQNKGSKISGKLRSIFRRKSRCSKKIFRAEIRSADVPP